MENELKVIRRKYGDKRIVTVLLGMNHPRERKFFHCINCGSTVFHYYSEIHIIIEGEIREVARPIDIMCTKQGCKTIYRIA